MEIRERVASELVKVARLLEGMAYWDMTPSLPTRQDVDRSLKVVQQALRAKGFEPRKLEFQRYMTYTEKSDARDSNKHLCVFGFSDASGNFAGGVAGGRIGGRNVPRLYQDWGIVGEGSKGENALARLIDGYINKKTRRGRDSYQEVKMASSRSRFAYNPDKEFEAQVKAVADLAQKFKDAHADLIAELNAQKALVKKADDKLKEAYASWKRDSGYEKARREMLKQAQQLLDIGDKLDGFGDDLEVAKRWSGAESFKEKFNVLVSTLNEAELNKFSRILDTYFNKVKTEFRAGLTVLDHNVTEWHSEAKALAEERGIKLSHRREGGLASAWIAVKSIIPKLVRTVKTRMTNLYRRLVGYGRVVEKMESEIDKSIAKFRRLM